MKYYLCIIISILLVGCSSLNKEETHHAIRGFNYNKSGEYTKALGELKLAYKSNKKNELLVNEIAFAYSNLNNFDMAKEYYKKTLELNNKNEKALLNLAIIDYKQGKSKESLALLKQMPDDSLNYQMFIILGYINYDNENYKEAYNLFNKSLNYEMTNNYEFVTKYIETLKKVKKDNLIYPYLYNAYEKNQAYLEPEKALEYSYFIMKLFKDDKKAFSILNSSLLYKKNDKVILELAKLKIRQKKYIESKAYINVLSEAYRYDPEALKLKEILKAEGVNK